MGLSPQQERAEHFRQLHHQASPLVLPNAWDAASARIIAQAGFPAIATTSSGVAASLGYSDGQKISRELLLEALARITRVVACPVTADIEAGFGSTLEEVLQTVKAVLATGVVGINIEDSFKGQQRGLVDISYQVELISALRELANSLDIPFVINARVDIFLLAMGEPETRFEQAIQRADAYLRAGADCIYPIGMLERATIADLVKEIKGPINIMGGSPELPLTDLASLGVARVSLAGAVMRSVLGHIQAITRELLEQGTFTSLNAGALSGSDFRSLFA